MVQHAHRYSWTIRDIVIVGNQFTMCNKQKQVDDYFRSVSDFLGGSQTVEKKDSFRTVADATKDISHVDSLVPIGHLLDMDMKNELELDSIDTTVAPVAVILSWWEMK